MDTPEPQTHVRFRDLWHRYEKYVRWLCLRAARGNLDLACDLVKRDAVAKRDADREIRRAVRRAVLETEMYGVSVATLYKALVDYARGEGTAARNTIDAQTRRKTGAQILAEVSAAEMITQQQKTR